MRSFAMFAIYILSSSFFSIIASAQTPAPPLNASRAKEFFQSAQRLSDHDDGKLWGRKLSGPILFVDFKTRAVIANQQDSGGLLHPVGDVFQEKLPEDVIVANTRVEWSGTRWTMMVWDMIPEDRFLRDKMFAHEMFHRIQKDLKLNSADTLNPHLDSLEGRVWLQLEWRALAAALLAKGPAQTRAIQVALAFRKYRQTLFPDAEESERSLEIAEGIPEYTGVTVAAPDAASARWAAVAKLTNPDPAVSLVRSFAYTSGPPYGLLLDQRLPGWRSKLSMKSDLGRPLASTVNGSRIDPKESATDYGIEAIRNAENDRAHEMEATKARYRKRLVESPTLALPTSKDTNFTFNPSALVSLDAEGTVYPTLRVTGEWGALDVTDGALLQKDVRRVVVTVPTKNGGSKVEGAGWSLALNPGWRVVPVSGSKNFAVEKK